MSRIVTIQVVVTDPFGGTSGPSTANIVINEPPIIDQIVVDPPVIIAGQVATITVLARDPEGDTLTYSLTASEGTVTPTAQPNVFQYVL